MLPGILGGGRGRGKGKGALMGRPRAGTNRRQMWFYVPASCRVGEEGGEGVLEKGGARERGLECIMYGYSKCVNCTRGYS
jgi:hypothetical protein